MHPIQLSIREKEVVGLLLQGKSNKQIALALGISVRTVEFHLKNVYGKYAVSSRIELILKLVNTTGSQIMENLVDSTVAREGGYVENRDMLNPSKAWVVTLIGNFSILIKELKMKKRWLLYLFAGLLFGACYWHYLGITAKIFNDFVNSDNPVVAVIVFIIALLTYFSVWLIPAVAPALFEFRSSASLRQSVLAVVVVWLSAVFGYYINYLVMLAVVGLPNMEYLLIFGQQTSSLWEDWSAIFPGLILYNFLKWAAVGIVVAGISGWVTGSIASSLTKKTYKTLPI